MQRDAFLERVRSSIGAATLPAGLPEDPGALLPDLPRGSLVEEFSSAAEAVDAVVHVGDPGAVIRSLVATYGPGPLLTWDPSTLPVERAAEQFAALGCTSLPTVVPGDPVGRLRHQGAYEEAQFGLTAAEAGFAETGSIVLRSGPGQPRMASLIPLVHVALLPVDRIFRSPMHWLVEGEPNLGEATNVVYITGPSRTADIEQQINLGVHGPRHVHIVLV
jgi:L-lactate dehydrogenase complex protein LldG